MSEAQQSGEPLGFQTVRTLPDGRSVEHLHTTLVEQLGDILIVDEHVLIDGEYTTVRIELDLAELGCDYE